MSKDIRKIRPPRIFNNTTAKANLLGKELIKYLYPNILMLARKTSGKTTVIYHLIKHTVDAQTEVIIMCPTVNKDPTYIAIQRLLKKRKIPNQIYDYADEDTFQALITSFEGESDDEQEPEPEPPEPCFIKHDCYAEGAQKHRAHELIGAWDTNKQTKKQTKKKKPFIVLNTIKPKRLLIIDDVDKKFSRSEVIANFAKKNRHSQTRFIISVQFIHQLHPDCFSQLDLIYLFCGMTYKLIKKLNDRRAISNELTIKEFYKQYKKLTQTKYSWVNLDLIDYTIRSKFESEAENL